MENFREYINEGRAIDLFVAYRFLRILTTPWEDQEAFAHGIIDADGKRLKKANELKTEDEKKSFTLLHRLIFNLKRILHKIPGVRTKIGTYATALYLLKQHVATDEEEEKMIETAFKSWLLDNGHIESDELDEQVIKGMILPKGRYRLAQDIYSTESEIKANKGDAVVIFSNKTSIGEVLGQNIFKVVHQKSKEEIYVALEDLKNA
tara:strand:- start:1131 stop:1748 length:618 start_codon:yes stop_codon:yes gene_type:complete